MTEQEELDCMSVDPFEGDFGDPGDRVLKDKIGTARKAGECHCCAQQIQPGERVRIRAEISDGQMMSFRWCQKCCVAMASSWRDDGRAWGARIEMRRAVPNAKLCGERSESERTTG